MKIFRQSIILGGIALLGLGTLNSCKKEFSEEPVIEAVATPSVYIGNNNNFVYALDPTTGAKKWEINAGSAVLASVVVHDNAAWVASSAGMLYKVNRATGKVVAERNFSAPILVTPLVYDGKIYVAAGSKIHLIDNTALTTIFSEDAGGAITGAPTIHNILGVEYPMLFVSAQNTVRSFRYDSLFVNTTFTAPDAGTFAMSPCIENDTVMYIGNLNGKVYAVNTRNNTVKWSYTSGGPITSTVLTIGGNILFGSADRNFYSIDTETGRLRWKHLTGGEITGAPYVYNQNVYFGSFDKFVYCIDIIDGEVVWQLETPALMKGSPVVSQEKVYIAGYDQIMYCLNAEDGKQYWTKNIGGTVDGAPMVDNIDTESVSAIDGNHPLK